MELWGTSLMQTSASRFVATGPLIFFSFFFSKQDRSLLPYFLECKPYLDPFKRNKFGDQNPTLKLKFVLENNRFV
jgi:hypothetical protein